jgi:glutathionyl-hydroquinone reductase
MEKLLLFIWAREFDMAIHHHIKCHSLDDPLEAYAIKMDFNQDIYIISTFNTHNQIMSIKSTYYVYVLIEIHFYGVSIQGLSGSSKNFSNIFIFLHCNILKEFLKS